MGWGLWGVWGWGGDGGEWGYLDGAGSLFRCWIEAWDWAKGRIYTRRIGMRIQSCARRMSPVSGASRNETICDIMFGSCQLIQPSLSVVVP